MTKSIGNGPCQKVLLFYCLFPEFAGKLNIENQKLASEWMRKELVSQLGMIMKIVGRKNRCYVEIFF